MQTEIRPEDRARYDKLLSKWEPPGEHPIARLDGLALGDYRVIALLGPKNAVGSRWYQLLLADAAGRLADEPLAIGLHNSGPYPAYNWVEMTQFDERPGFAGETVDLWSTGLAEHLFLALSELVPPGGHMMVEYDSPTHRATERILTLRYPPATSPIGHLMFRAGARSYRDWYISEGGREGPRKLQGFKPLNDEIAAEKVANLRRDVEAMLSQPENSSHGQWGALARKLGKSVLESV